MNMLEALEDIIQQRHRQPSETSYTSQLFAAGSSKIAQKVGEEAVEVIVAALSQPREAQVNELADLFFHVLVLMRQMDISLKDVNAELERRHFNKSGADR
jgi:phosphoribosyl-ATP pyrophosphohydrolase